MKRVGEQTGSVRRMQPGGIPWMRMQFGYGLVDPPDIPDHLKAVSAVGIEMGREKQNLGPCENRETRQVDKSGSEKQCSKSFPGYFISHENLRL
jgi:hypothetical protein